MWWKSFLGPIKHSLNFCVIQFTDKIAEIILAFVNRKKAWGPIIFTITVLGDRHYYNREIRKEIEGLEEEL